MDLAEIVKRSKILTNDLKHGNVDIDSEHIEMEMLDALCDEILQEFSETKRYNDMKKMMMNMFFLGQFSNKS